MPLTLTQSSGPSIEPVSRADMKLHLRVDDTADDGYIDSLIQAAREWCEDFTNRQFIQATWVLYLDAFPAWNILLPRPPLSSITSIAYIDTGGTSQTFSSDDYTVDTDSTPGRVYPNYDESWPATRAQQKAVTITYVAGFGTATTDVPESINQAIKLLCGHWYENREEVIVGTISKQVEFAVDALLRRNQVVELA